MTITPNEVSAIRSAVMQEVYRLRNNAGYNGDMTDGGAGALERELAAWVSGIQGTVPATMDRIWRQSTSEREKERAEYHRLKAKFEP